MNMPKPMRTLALLMVLMVTMPVAAITLDQAVAKVRGQTQGRVLSAETRGGTHMVRILTPQGRVKQYQVDVKGGAVQAAGKRK